MALANQEAQRLNHDYIGTEHILLGLIEGGFGVGVNALKNLGVDIRGMRDEVEKLIRSGPGTGGIGKLPQTPRAKKVVEYALLEARDLGHNYVGTEHLLLGLLKEEEGVAAQVLRNLGLTLERVRAEVLSLLGAAVPTGPDAPPPVPRVEAGGKELSALPLLSKQELPRWPAAAAIVFGVAVIAVGYCLSAWILNLNAYRAVAETLAASMERNDAAYRAGRPRQPRLDPLNPATWSLDPSADPHATERERQHVQQVARQIAVVEVGTKIWKLAMWAIGVLVLLLGLLALKIRRRRSALLVGVALLGLIATALTVVGMRVLIVHGGFHPRPTGDFVTVAAIGSAYPWLLLAYLVGFRAGTRARGPHASDIANV